MGDYSPADSVLGHVPSRTLGPIPQIPGLDDILLQRSRNLPLVVVECGRGRRDGTAGEDLSGVRENLGSPPLQLSVICRRKSANEWLAYAQLAISVRLQNKHTYPPRVCSPGSQQACPYTSYTAHQ